MMLKSILTILLLSQSVFCFGQSVEEFLKKGREAVDSNTRVTIYTRAIKKHSQNARLYHERGVTYGIIEYHDKALTDFGRAIELDPNYTIAFKNRALAYHRVKKFKESVHDCQKFIELKPGKAFGYYLLGVNYANLEGKWSETETNINKAIELDPSYKDNSSVRKIKYQIKKRKKFSSFKIKEKTPDNKIANKEPIIETEVKKKKSIVYKKRPDSTKGKVLINKAKGKMRRKQYEEAIELYTDALEIEGEIPSVYADIAFAKYRLDKKEDADFDIEQVLQIDPACAKAFLYKAYIKAEEGDISGAQTDLDKALSLNKKIKREFNYNKVKIMIRRHKQKN